MSLHPNLMTTILHNLPQAVIACDGERRILYLNPAAEALTGWPLNEVVGRQCNELHICPNCQNGGTCLLEAVLRSDQAPYVRDLTIKPLTGEPLRVHMAAAPLNDPQSPDGIIATLTPLVDGPETEALQLSEERYRGLYRALPGGVLIVDRTDTIIEANSTACQIFGLPSDDVTGHTLSDSVWGAIHEDGTPFSGEEYPSAVTLRTGQPVRGVVMGLSSRHWAEPRWVMLNSEPLCNPRTGEVEAAIVHLVDITMRKQREQALLQSETFLGDVLNGLTSNIAVLDGDGTIIAVNAAWRRFAEANDIAVDWVCEGTNYLAICDQAEGPYSEEARPFAAGIREVLAGRTASFEMEYPCHSPDEQRWFMGRVTPVSGEGPRRAIVAHENITARRLSEDALRASEERFRTLAENAPVGLFIHRQGKVLYANATGLSMFGYAALADVLGSSILQYLAPCSRDEVIRNLAETTRDGQRPWAYEATCVRRDGSEFPVQVRAMDTDLPDGPAGAVFLLDLTERKLIEDGQRLMALGQLAGGIAHDFNNLLAAMSMNAELVGLRGGSADAHELADVVLRTTDRGADICRNLMAFALPDQPTRDLANIEACIDAALDVADRQLRAAGVQVIRGYDPAPISVFVDTGQMTEVFLNAVTNALHAMPQGGRLAVATRYEADATTGGVAIITVTDTGEGITPENLPHIFEPFFTTKGRLGESDTPGTGLGLSVSHGIISAHGGSIAVHSEVGVGTTVEVRLPLHMPPE